MGYRLVGSGAASRGSGGEPMRHRPTCKEDAMDKKAKVPKKPKTSTPSKGKADTAKK